MKTISLKMPDDVYEKVEKYRKALDKNRSNYVMEAVVEYTKSLEREELAEQLRRDAVKTAEESKEYGKEIEELEVTLMDGLPDDDWPEYNTKEFLESIKKEDNQ